jgi:TRAP-type C4-dicarboxylate transport system permease small subunit
MSLRRGLDALERVVIRLSSASVYVAIASLLLLVIVVTLGVITRYAFNRPLIGGDEIASYCMLLVVFFGLAQTLAEEGHIRIDIVVRLLGPRAQAVVECVAYILGVAFSIFLATAVYTRIENFWVRNTVSIGGTGMPLYLPALPLLLGSVMLALMMVINALRSLRHLLALRAGAPGKTSLVWWA